MPHSSSNLASQGDAALAELARAGNSDAFAELWTRHVGAGTAAARQFSTIADPEDIVSEAYLRIFRAVQHGGGPHEAFRPYLYRTIRNIALDWRAKQNSVSLDETAELEQPDSDPEISVLENVVTARAFADLPERWQAVLWYLDVEGMSPAEAAPLTGLSPNATSALAVRAREGFKKAWLQAHINDLSVPSACRWTTDRMAQYSRRTLSPRARSRFDRHLEDCARCSILVEEMDRLSGHLASVLLPAVLGAGAGGAMLAQLARPAAAETGPRLTTTQKALAAGAGVVVLVLAASGAAAITGQWSSTHAPTSSDSHEQTSPPTAPPSPSPSPSAPDATQTPQPSGSPPPGPAQPPVVSPPPTPRDHTPPAAPGLITPEEGLLSAASQPTFTGSGEPGAFIDVQRIDATTGALVPVASTRVAGSGLWSVAAAQAIPDGSHVVRVTQRDAAGNRSPETSRTITIDTVALAPAIDALPSSAQFYLPEVTGAAEPGALVALRDETDTVIATTTAGDDGRWLIALPDPEDDSITLSASQRDPAGNVSPWSTPTATLSFERPQFASPVNGEPVPSTAGSTVVTVELAGREGLQVQVFIDGAGTGNLHTLEAQPIVRVTPPLADGVHSLGVRYFDPTTGRPGAMHTIQITIG